MIRVVQFGEGNFLRAFVDTYFNALNEEGYGPYSVCIVKPIVQGSLEKFDKQQNRYHTVLRGCGADGAATECVYPISVVSRVVDPFSDHEAYLSLARERELRIIVSNTTEAGIVYREEDTADDFASMSYPAKLTLFLYERFKAGLPGVHILPCELIDSNADALRECVDRYIRRFGLPEDFYNFNKKNNIYLNTLVDRIVSGYPKDTKTREHLHGLIGKEDALMTVGEPFGLWAVERGGDIESLLLSGRHNIDVVLTDDIAYYKKRKVRVLNGAHTGIVPMGLWHGMRFVSDCMENERIHGFLLGLFDEIIPYVSENTEDTARFASDVITRFKNPYLGHALTSILLNSISKWTARNMPSLLDYYRANAALPRHLTLGLAYLLALYSRAEKMPDGSYVSKTPSGEVALCDDERYLSFFAEGGSVRAFLESDAISPELSRVSGLIDTVEELCQRILSGEDIF